MVGVINGVLGKANDCGGGCTCACRNGSAHESAELLCARLNLAHPLVSSARGTIHPLLEAAVLQD
jgi:hypothetical protein